MKGDSQNPDAASSRYEAAVIADAGGSWIDGVLAGTSRHLRVNAAVDSTVYRTATQVVGPVLSGYVLWILAQAFKSGVNRLHFVSRDGFLLKQLADIMIAELQIPLSTSYLLGSRAAWHGCAIRRPLQEASWLYDGIDQSLSRVCDMIGLSRGQVRQMLSGTHWVAEDWEVQRSREWLGRFLAELDCHRGEEIENLITTSPQRETARCYLAGSGVGRGDDGAIVDLGWQGRAQDSLEAILEKPVKGFYFALKGDREANRMKGRFSMFPEWFQRGHAEKPDSFMHLLEAFSSEMAGTVVGYARSGEGVIALRGDFPERELRAWGIDDLHAGVQDYGRLLASSLSGRPYAAVLGEDLKPAVQRLMIEFSTNPSLEEVQVWGSYPYQVSQGLADFQPLAIPSRLGPVSVWKWFKSGTCPCGRERSHANWEVGSGILTRTTRAGAMINLFVNSTLPLRRKVRRVLRAIGWNSR